MAGWREKLASENSPSAVDAFLEQQVVGDPFTGVNLDPDHEGLLRRRGAFLLHDGRLVRRITGASHPVQHPFVRVLSLADRWLPPTVQQHTYPGSLSGQLALTADVGQLASRQCKRSMSGAWRTAPPR